MLPAKQVYLEALASWSSLGGPLARGEAGVRVGEHLGLFAFGQWRPTETTAGAGARVTW